MMHIKISTLDLEKLSEMARLKEYRINELLDIEIVSKSKFSAKELESLAKLIKKLHGEYM